MRSSGSRSMKGAGRIMEKGLIFIDSRRAGHRFHPPVGHARRSNPTMAADFVKE